MGIWRWTFPWVAPLVFSFRVELEFGVLVYEGREKQKDPEKNPRRNNSTLNPRVTPWIGATVAGIECSHHCTNPANSMSVDESFHAFVRLTVQAVVLEGVFLCFKLCCHKLRGLENEGFKNNLKFSNLLSMVANPRTLECPRTPTEKFYQYLRRRVAASILRYFEYIATRTSIRSNMYLTYHCRLKAVSKLSRRKKVIENRPRVKKE